MADEDYESMEDALFAALEAVKGMDNNAFEWTSLVYRDPNGRVRYSPPVGGKTKGSFREGIKIPKGSTILSLAHNHPNQKGGNEQHFSDADILQSQKLKIPSAIAYGPGYATSMFTPGRSKVVQEPFGKNYSEGELFNHIPEVKPAGVKLGLDQQALIAELRKEVP